MSNASLPSVDEAHLACLRERIRSTETQWVEGKAKEHEKTMRKSLVAFANAVRDGKWAVQFFGALDSLQHPGVANADEVQLTATDFRVELLIRGNQKLGYTKSITA